MTKQSKITATEARIPLAMLTLSPLNPRQHVPEHEVAELAQSIWDAGLIQPIAGLADGMGGADIVAGGRRLRALQYLAMQHPNMADTRPELANPMVMLAPDQATAEQWAYTENVARRDLSPADEIRAYGKMKAAGSTPAAIARSFAVTEKHVYRRLALADLPTQVIDALAEGEINLSMAACFTICDDEKHSLEVLERVRGENWNDYQLKNMLKPDSVKGTDRRAIFVGEGAYKKAGGRIGGDLFTEETLFDNPDILETLFVEKLEAEAKRIRKDEGWNWVEPVEDSYVCSYSMGLDKYGRVYAQAGDLTEDQSERYDELAELAEGEVLDEKGHAELETLQAILDGDFTEEQKVFAGAYVYVGRDGRVQVSAGFIKPETKKAAIEAGVLRGSAHNTSGDSQPKLPISQKLRDDLSRVAQGARQHAVLRDPDLLIDLLAYQLSHSLRWNDPLGIATTEVPNWPSTEAEGYGLDERLTSNPPREMWGAKDLGASFRAFRKKGPEHVRGELVRFLAAQYRGGDEKLSAMIDKETQPNIREVWTPNAANFFSRVGGPYLNDLWCDLLDLSEDHPSATTFAKLKKVEKAEKLEKLFSDADMRKAHNVTDEQAAKIDAWLPEGMG